VLCLIPINYPTTENYYGFIEILQGNDQHCDGQWLREQTLAAVGIYTFPQRLQQLLLNSASIAGDRLHRERQPNGDR
jgi:hypothetical protein